MTFAIRSLKSRYPSVPSRIHSGPSVSPKCSPNTSSLAFDDTTASRAGSALMILNGRSPGACAPTGLTPTASSAANQIETLFTPHHQPPHHQPPTTNHQPPTTNHQPLTTNHQQDLTP